MALSYVRRIRLTRQLRVDVVCANVLWPAELLALLVTGGCLVGCDKPAVTSLAQRELTIAVGPEDSVSDHLGRALALSSETDTPGLTSADSIRPRR